jgi:hypothetical protein
MRAKDAEPRVLVRESGLMFVAIDSGIFSRKILVFAPVMQCVDHLLQPSGCGAAATS